MVLPITAPNADWFVAMQCYGSTVYAVAVWVGWVKMGDFRQIAGCISKTVQDRRIVSMKVE